MGLFEIEHIQEATFWWRCYSCLVSGVLNLLVEEAQALRPHQFGFKVKLLIASQEILGKWAYLADPQLFFHKIITVFHGHVTLCQTLAYLDLRYLSVK